MFLRDHGRDFFNPLSRLVVFSLLVAVLQGPHGLAAQTEQRRLEVIAAAMEHVQQKGPEPYFIQCLVDLKAIQAVPLMKQKYAALQDNPTASSQEDFRQEIEKGKVAAGLIRLGATDNTYWEYLFERAKAATTRDFPDFLLARPSTAPDGVSAEFTEWAKSQHLSPEAAAFRAVYGDMGSVGFLAASGDPRAVPLLREGLRAQSPLVRLRAATGLADLQDNASLPFLVEAFHSAKTEERYSYAIPLAYFDDPEAQRIASATLPPEVLQEIRERKARGCTPSTCWSTCVDADISKWNTAIAKPPGAAR